MTDEPIHPAGKPSQHVQHVQSLFVANSNVLRGFILGLLPEFHDAEDVFQEVFLTVTAKADSYKEGTNFVSWACAIAKFKVLERIRAHNLERLTLSPETINALAASAPQDSYPDRIIQRLTQCIDRLAPMARRILDLRYQDRQPPGQIASLLGQKRESIYVTLSRTRDFLKKCIKNPNSTPAK